MGKFNALGLVTGSRLGHCGYNIIGTDRATNVF